MSTDNTLSVNVNSDNESVRGENLITLSVGAWAMCHLFGDLHNRFGRFGGFIPSQGFSRSLGSLEEMYI